MLAGLPDMQYDSCRLTMGRGDTLFLYTDGVTEALNPAEELFGEERLRDVLNRTENRCLPVEQLLPRVRTALAEYAQNAEQADDITMLGITYRGPGNGQTLVVPADRAQLETVQHFVDTVLDRLSCPDDVRIPIQISVEELFVNIASYAYPPGEGKVMIECREEHEPAAITIVFRDRGIPFDPLAKPDADITQSADERSIGGLGIFMVKDTMDQVDYAYEDGMNVLTVRKVI